MTIREITAINDRIYKIVALSPLDYIKLQDFLPDDLYRANYAEIKKVLVNDLMIYNAELEQFINEVPKTFSYKLLDRLTEQTVSFRDYRIFTDFHGIWEGFVLRDKLEEFNTAKLDQLKYYYNWAKYSQIVNLLQGMCDNFLESLEHLKNELDNNISETVSEEEKDAKDLVVALRLVIQDENKRNNLQPESENLNLSGFTDTLPQIRDENNTNYKVWMLHKLGVLKTLNDTYFLKNPSAKKEKFAELIAIITDSKMAKLDTVKRYITAALANESIDTNKLKDELDKTLKEHNLY